MQIFGPISDIRSILIFLELAQWRVTLFDLGQGSLQCHLILFLGALEATLELQYRL